MSNTELKEDADTVDDNAIWSGVVGNLITTVLSAIFWFQSRECADDCPNKHEPPIYNSEHLDNALQDLKIMVNQIQRKKCTCKSKIPLKTSNTSNNNNSNKQIVKTSLINNSLTSNSNFSKYSNNNVNGSRTMTVESRSFTCSFASEKASQTKIVACYKSDYEAIQRITVNAGTQKSELNVSAFGCQTPFAIDSRPVVVIKPKLPLKKKVKPKTSSTKNPKIKEVTTPSTESQKSALVHRSAVSLTEKSIVTDVSLPCSALCSSKSNPDRHPTAAYTTNKSTNTSRPYETGATRRNSAINTKTNTKYIQYTTPEKNLGRRDSVLPLPHHQEELQLQQQNQHQNQREQQHQQQQQQQQPQKQHHRLTKIVELKDNLEYRSFGKKPDQSKVQPRKTIYYPVRHFYVTNCVDDYFNNGEYCKMKSSGGELPNVYANKKYHHLKEKPRLRLFSEYDDMLQDAETVHLFDTMTNGATIRTVKREITYPDHRKIITEITTHQPNYSKPRFYGSNSNSVRPKTAPEVNGNHDDDLTSSEMQPPQSCYSYPHFASEKYRSRKF